MEVTERIESAVRHLEDNNVDILKIFSLHLFNNVKDQKSLKEELLLWREYRTDLSLQSDIDVLVFNNKETYELYKHLKDK